MALTRLRCTNCGADFDNVDLQEGQRVFKCSRIGCGAAFIVDQGSRFTDVEQTEAEKIQKYRAEMMAALEPFNRELAAQHAGRIMDILPRDYRARAVLSLCQAGDEDNRPIYDFLQSDAECTGEEFAEVFEPLLNRCDYTALLLLKKAIDRLDVDRGQRDALLKRTDKQIEHVKMVSDYYADVPRDVFICHKHSDIDFVMRVMDALELDGNACWISERNMPPDSRHYWDKIERAIERCKVFLVICSDEAMYSGPVQKELGIADQKPLKRLELKVGGAPHTSLFSHFFEGLSWVEYTGDFEASMAALKEAVYELIHTAEEAPAAEPEPEPAPIPEPAPAKKKKQGVAQEDTAEYLMSLSHMDLFKYTIAQKDQMGLLQSTANKLKSKNGELEKQVESLTQEKLQLKNEASRLNIQVTANNEEIERLKGRAAQAERQRAAEKQARSYRDYTLLALALFLVRVLLTASLTGSATATLVSPDLFQRVLYLLTVLVDLRILIKKTAKPRYGVAVLLLIPLALDFWYFLPSAEQTAESAYTAMMVIRAAALVVAFFAGSAAKSAPAVKG